MKTPLLKRLRSLFDLRADTDMVSTDESIRTNVDFKSANAWTLVFAIFIASVGLNVNSTAVIIGAMLISPLMGPIVGAGYALGINDFDLLRRSARNLLIAMGISLITSMIYFLVSPFNEVQSELLARTSPNFYDVLIAAFGGAAGIVALSRKEKSNAIPGVAIATALMPPLCTAGFAIAHLEWKFALGALYLFVINSVFICLSTYIFVRYLRFPKTTHSPEDHQRNIDRWVMAVAAVVIIPSFVTAYLLLKESTFKAKANAFIEREFQFKGTYLMEKKITYSWDSPKIVLTAVGQKVSNTKLKFLEEKKDLYGLQSAELKIQQVAVDDQIEAKIAKSNKSILGQTALYQSKITELETQIALQKNEKKLEQNVLIEAQIFNKDIISAYLSDAKVIIVWKRPPHRQSRLATEEFVKHRLELDKIQIVHVTTI